MKFRKKPVEIEALRLTEEAAHDALLWIRAGGAKANFVALQRFRGIDIYTLEGTMRADVGDWIIRGVQGEFYPCKPDIFEATYEPVEEARP